MVSFSSILRAAPFVTAAIYSPLINGADAKKSLRHGGTLSVSSTGGDITTQKLFYPDSQSKTCLNDENMPDEMATNAQFLFADLETCCQAFFWGGLELCIGQEPMKGGRKLKDRNNAEERELGWKSGKSSKSNKSGKSEYKYNSSPYWNWNWNWNGKSGKSDKSGKSSKSSKSSYRYPKPPPKSPKPTRRPTRRPSRQPTGQPVVTIPENPIQITMGGSLTSINVDVPTAGSDELRDLAGVFEKTILRALNAGYSCDVYSIGGTPVNDGMAISRHLQTATQTEVLFYLRTVRPCPDCDSTGALMLGARVFDEAFETLDEKAESGELSVIFCIFAEVAGLVEEPCTVAITNAEGESLDVEFVDDPDAPTTPMPPTGALPGQKPTPLPTMVATPKPTPPPVNDNTEEPTDPPVMEWPPTPSPVAVSVPVTPTIPPVVSTNPPVVPTQPPMETTMPPATATSSPSPRVTSPPTSAGTSIMPTAVNSTMPTVPVSTMPTIFNTTMPSTAPSSKPTSGSTGEMSSIPTIIVVPTPPPTAVITSPPTVGSTTASPSSSPSIGSTTTVTTPSPSSSPSTGSTPSGSTAMPAAGSMMPTAANVTSALPTVSNFTSTTPTSVTAPTGSFGPTISAEPSSSTYFPTNAPTMAGSGDTPSSNIPTPASSGEISTPPTPGVDEPGSIAPTFAFPPNAIYFDSFEQGTFPDDEEWSTDGDAIWELAIGTSNSGSHSIRSGSLVENGFSNVTFTTSPDFVGGTMFLSILASVELPVDDVFYLVDGVFMGPIPPSNDWVSMDIPLLPGEHSVDFAYLYNPFQLDQFPPDTPGHIKAVFIDDVFILPDGGIGTMPPVMSPGTSPPTMKETSMPTSSSTTSVSSVPNMQPSSTMPTTLPLPTTSRFPTPVSGSTFPTPSSTNVTSIAPTPSTPTGSGSIPPTFLFPPDAIYINSFEQATFPDDEEWSTEGDAVWSLTNEQANTGVYSIRSGILRDSGIDPKNSNVTFTTTPDFIGGIINLSILADTQMPIDDCLYFIDGIFGGIVPSSSEWEFVSVPLAAGEHTVMVSYKYNPLSQDELPPPSGNITGAVYIDDVFILSLGTPPGGSPSPTLRPTVAGIGTTVPTSVSASMTPTSVSGSMMPSTGSGSLVPTADSGSMVPTVTLNGTTAPTPRSSVTPPSSTNQFDGFESGDLTGLDWVVTGVPGWVVDQTNPFEGSYSVHVRTEDIPISGNYSQLDLITNLDQATFVQFYFNAPISMPFESLDLWVDGNFLTPLTTPDGNWTQAGAIVAPGEHTVSWRYSKNPGGAPDDVLETLPQPPFRIGEAWLDNVELIPSTSSFTEGFESGNFDSQPWILSGNGSWEITDAVQNEGTYSATALTANIEPNTGTADLSIDIITESGGMLYFAILSSVSGPHDIVNILIDDTVVGTYADLQEDWFPGELAVQPGKRRITWQLVKNPGGLPDDIISTIPKPEGSLGQVWLDEIDFRSN